MNKKVKEKWLKALRSGEYRKGEDQLCRHWNHLHTDEFCCLGVLWEEQGHEWMPGDFSKGLLPASVAKSVGLSLRDQKALAVLNDKSTTFAPVIRWIEKNL